MAEQTRIYLDMALMRMCDHLENLIHTDWLVFPLATCWQMYPSTSVMCWTKAPWCCTPFFKHIMQRELSWVHLGCGTMLFSGHGFPSPTQPFQTMLFLTLSLAVTHLLEIIDLSPAFESCSRAWDVIPHLRYGKLLLILKANNQVGNR